MGIFTLSIDFELILGFLGRSEKQLQVVKKKRFSNIRERIHELLKLLDTYNIKTTWATSGHLFLENCSRDHRLEDNEWLKRDPGTNLQENPLWYGRDIIDDILHENLNHEIACHSFSHVPFNKISQKRAIQEIKLPQELAKTLGIDLQSFVFPRHKIANRKALKKCGIKCYRTPPERSHSNKFWKVFDYLLGLKYPKPVPPELDSLGMTKIASSLFLYVGKKARLLTRLLPSDTLLWKWKKGLEETVKRGGVFHMILHPYNFKREVAKKDLEKLLAKVREFSSKSKLQVSTMKEISKMKWEREE